MDAQPMVVQQALGARLQQLEPGTPRYNVVAAAQKFKASWVELAQHLSDLRQRKAFEGWGYPTFSQYCRQELHIKQETADKLTRSYGYLRERAPAVLEASSSATQVLPPLDVVDLLSQAKARTTICADAWNSLEGEVLAGDATHSRTKLLKRLREVDPEVFAAKAPAPQAAAIAIAVDGHSLRKVLLLAERLESLLQGMAAGIGGETLAAAEKVAESLRKQVDAQAKAGASGPQDPRRGAAAKPGAESQADHLPPASGMQ